MKTTLITSIWVFVFLNIFAQSPQSFQYQAVVRDVSGNPVSNQYVGFQISIISGSITGSVQYVEIHTESTNAYGIVTLNIGSGTPLSGAFSLINWESNIHFVKVEADPTGGSTYIDMGTTQLLSVPYALFSEKAGNIPTYSGGYGIDVTGTTITNTAPDQAVTLTQGGATTVSGTYPNFTISSTDNNTTYSAGTGINITGTTITNTAPDQAVSLTQGGATTVSGTYPNFTISSTDNNTTYSAGTGINITGTTITNTAPNQTVTLSQGGATSVSGAYPNFTISSTDLNSGTPGGLNKTIQYNNLGTFDGDTALAWDNSNKRLGIGLSNPSGRVVIKGSTLAPATEALFEVKNKLGQTVFVVYEDSVNVFVNDDVIQSNRGGFAVSGRNNAKAFTNKYMHVTPDNSKIWTKDTLQGFGVENINGTNKTSYMQMTPDNYFIGHQAGNSITTGKYNSFIGFQAGYSDTSGNNNYFIGYNSGFNNLSGYSNIFLGDNCGYSNTVGTSNVFIGDHCGYSNIFGTRNVFLGYYAGYTNNGNFNVFLGDHAGFSNTSGWGNTANGYYVLYSNTTGTRNVANGYQALYFNTSGNNNVANGFQALYSNETGYSNVANGHAALYSNLSGINNVANGYTALYNNTSGIYNTATGAGTLSGNTTGEYNTATGSQALTFNTIGSYNTASGMNALMLNSTASRNTAVGNSALRNQSFNNGGLTWNSDNVAIGAYSLYNNQPTLTTNGIQNTAIGSSALRNNTSGYNNSANGMNALYSITTGYNNSALGYNAFGTGTVFFNSTALGANAPITQSNKVRIGDATVTVIEGQVAYTFPSDGRFKNNVTEDVKGLDFIIKLRPIVYNFDTKKFDAFLMKDMQDSLREEILSNKDYTESTNIRQTGFIAQEVLQAAKESGFDFNGVHKPSNESDNYSVAYSLFTVPLVKGMQEQQKIIENQNSKINDLQKQIDELRSLITNNNIHK